MIYKADDNYTVYTISEGRLNYLTFNYQCDIWKNEDARKAVCLALNADEIVAGAYGSEELAIPAKNFCSPESLYYNDEMTGYEQNIEEAKHLAEESFMHLFAAWITGQATEDTSWDLAANGMDSLNGDPAAKMTSWKGELIQNGFYMSEETKELWEKAARSLDLGEREEFYKELQVQMNEDYLLYPMANTNYVIVARKEFKGLDAIDRYSVF